MSGSQKNWEKLKSSFYKLGFTLHKDYNELDSFKHSNKLKVANKGEDRIAAAYYSLFGDDIISK